MLPNLILARVFLGNQGHALSLASWRKELGVTHVINLAADRVPPAEGENVVYLTSPSGLRLSDVAGEQEVFGRLALELVPAIDEAVASGGNVFIHCQQGRSRSCALAVAYLMRRKGDGAAMSLRAALEHVAERRPEMEINEAYLRALAEWEEEAPPPSCTVDGLIREQPRWVRTAGVAREHAQR